MSWLSALELTMVLSIMANVCWEPGFEVEVEVVHFNTSITQQTNSCQHSNSCELMALVVLL